MWVAIYNDAGAGGTVRVEEFRKRADVATAVSQFQDDYTPPKTGYAGIDVGWTAYVDPPKHQEWHVDRDAVPDPVLIAVDKPLTLVFKGSRSVTEATITTTTPVTVDGLRSRVSTWVDDPSDALGSVTGEIQVTGGDCKLRIMMGDDETGNPIVPLSDYLVHPDTAGDWVSFTLLSNVDPVLALQRYFLEAEMVSPATSAEIRYASFSIFSKG
ncbi:MAG: hypothetical protein HRU16_04205 [Planctomycetes bacterium]|nr:hypothetical protein [Planctomycetota bacterium]